MTPIFLGGHAGIDFLNTAFEPDGERVETIGDGAALAAWLVEANLMSEPQTARLMRRLGTKGADAAAANARKLREWARTWLERWRKSPRADYRAELATLNDYLSKEATSRQVVHTEDGFRFETQAQIDTAEELLALLAATLASLVTEEDPQLLRSCAGPGCTLWFVDRTKAHRRLFCSAATCGNRAKVAAFRERRQKR
jgi:predicted RNA-binding Zn ribbon-like protein